MHRNEILELLKDKITPGYYVALQAWTKKREYKFFGLIKTKFDIRPLHLYGGYSVSVGYDFIHVYPK